MRTSHEQSRPSRQLSALPLSARPSIVSSSGSVYSNDFIPCASSATYKSVMRTVPDTCAFPSAISRLRRKRHPLASTMRAMSGR